MNKFKLNLKELIFLTILSVPIGGFLYFSNFDKITYKIMANRGFAVTQNFCENYAYNKIGLENSGDIELIYHKYAERQTNLNSQLHSKVKINLRNDLNIYEIIFKGKIGQVIYMEQEGKVLLSEISKLELSNFNRQFKSIKFHCKSSVFSVFSMIPMETINIEFPISKEYSKLRLGFMAVLPSIIFYFLWIAIRYIRIFYKSKL